MRLFFFFSLFLIFSVSDSSAAGRNKNHNFSLLYKSIVPFTPTQEEATFIESDLRGSRLIAVRTDDTTPFSSDGYIELAPNGNWSGQSFLFERLANRRELYGPSFVVEFFEQSERYDLVLHTGNKSKVRGVLRVVPPEEEADISEMFGVKARYMVLFPVSLSKGEMFVFAVIKEEKATPKNPLSSVINTKLSIENLREILHSSPLPGQCYLVGAEIIEDGIIGRHLKVKMEDRARKEIVFNIKAETDIMLENYGNTQAIKLSEVYLDLGGWAMGNLKHETMKKDLTINIDETRQITSLDVIFSRQYTNDFFQKFWKEQSAVYCR
jgi:hypothetical protein